MASRNLKGLLTAFSPYSEFLAVSSGDGRVKIWDTLRGQLQTEFANITSPAATSGLQRSLGERGHLSLDYKCMQWVQLGKKKKKKSAKLLLVLGTGSGDVIAFDVAAGTLKWKITDCHSGGANAISFSKGGSLYTGGVDGTVCQIDPSTGDLLGKFKASTKAISSLSVSADGSTIATAASQLKIFNCTNYKKIQKFSGHPVGVRCTTFTEDGKYVLTSGVGEKFVAIWKIDGEKNQPAACVLAMEHPAVFLGCKTVHGDENQDANFYILAISEIGLCYFWHGKNTKELRNGRSTKISMSFGHSLSKKHQDLSSTIFCAELQEVLAPTSVKALFAYGSLVKPSFENLLLQAGRDVTLTSPQDRVLLPVRQCSDTQKEQAIQIDAIALDCANAEDATIPIPKLYDSHNKHRKNIKHYSEVLDHSMVGSTQDDKECQPEVYMEMMEEDDVSLCMEDKLKAVGILHDKDGINLERPNGMTNLALDASLLREPLVQHLLNLPAKKIKSTILSMSPGDVLKFLEVLMLLWRTRSLNEKSIFPWLSSILVNHGNYIATHEPSLHMLETMHKMIIFKSAAAKNLSQLSGRLQLFMAQANRSTSEASLFHMVDGTESEDNDIDEVTYGEEGDMSESDDCSDETEDQS